MINNNIKISIIVPVYNAGEHLKRCIETLTNQTLKEIEIIIVLDCPTDGSDVVAEQYAKRDNRIKLIRNSKNINIGLSRNKGIMYASGEYIGFSDHDDYRELTMYEEMYIEAKKNNYDIVCSSFTSVKNSKCESNFYPESIFINVRESILSLLIGGCENTTENEKFLIQNGRMWNKIFKTQMIKENSISFIDNKTGTFEDLLFQIECFFYSKEAAVLNKVFYYHVEGINNTSSQYNYRSYTLINNYILSLYLFLNNNNIYEKYRINFYNAVVNSVLASIINEYYSSKKLSKKLSVFKYFRKNPIVKESFKNQEFFNITQKPRNKLTKLTRLLIFKFFKM